MQRRISYARSGCPAGSPRSVAPSDGGGGGSLTPVRGSLFPGGGSVSPGSGSLIPVSASLFPSGGSVSPGSGSLIPVSGSLFPGGGSLFPVGGSVFPFGVSVSPGGGSVYPGDGSFFPVGSRSVYPNGGPDTSQVIVNYDDTGDSQLDNFDNEEHLHSLVTVEPTPFHRLQSSLSPP
ncbi:hypothetical protein AC1031_005774 [Aphanomyces cochlioides]|nr:hypothetical protein AC1031_005774 [Aphanomyces cochlioides]